MISLPKLKKLTNNRYSKWPEKVIALFSVAVDFG
jgi:hypothetical protein